MQGIVLLVSKIHTKSILENIFLPQNHYKTMVLLNTDLEKIPFADENSTITPNNESRQQVISPYLNDSALNSDTFTPVNSSLNANSSLTHSMTLGRHDNQGRRKRRNLVARSTSIPAQKFFVTIDNKKHRFF